jgi:uncharacterized protein
MKDKFLCSQCGACCREAANLGLMPDRGDGACINLQQDNSCAIYETRPDICRVIGTKKDYIENTKVCHALIDYYDLDKKYKIDLNEYERSETE